ncbi:putative chitin synthase activator [Phyllosticta capitalensis]
MAYSDAVQVDRAPLPEQNRFSVVDDSAPAPPSTAVRRKNIPGTQPQPVISLSRPPSDSVHGINGDLVSNQKDNSSTQSRASISSFAMLSVNSTDVENPQHDSTPAPDGSVKAQSDSDDRQFSFTADDLIEQAKVASELKAKQEEEEKRLGPKKYKVEEPEFEMPQYFHVPYNPLPVKVEKQEERESTYSEGSSNGSVSGSRNMLGAPVLSLDPNFQAPQRNASPLSVNHLAPSPSPSPAPYGRSVAQNRRSPENRYSYVDLLHNIPYAQQHARTYDLTQDALRKLVGEDASLLDTQKTVDMYLANVKKTPDVIAQYEFGVFLVNSAKAFVRSGDATKKEYAETVMIKEARGIFQRLSDRSYPFAQYMLADGYYTGFFNKGKRDPEKALPLLVAASKHGHAEAGFRVGVMYEFGSGCRKDLAKAEQFYRASASKYHPGASARLGEACIYGQLGLGRRDREGLKWLKRGCESADEQYNTAPFMLGQLHETGYGADCFKDEAYALELYTQAAELGHARACLKMGEVYEHGLLGCPKDPPLSVHFYTGAAMEDIPEAMMNLCAWYLMGAPPALEKDENEAYEWAKRAAEFGLLKAEYAVGYFTEMGIGCRRDILEANVWYVKAAEKGDERAMQRLTLIRAAASGENPKALLAAEQNKVKKRGSKDDKDCVVM